MTLPSEPPPPVAPVPVQVITYASGQTISAATSGARVLLGFLAAFHFLLGAPIVLGPVAGVIRDLRSGYADPGGLVALAMGLIIGGLDIACGVWMLVRRPWTWRAAHVGLTVLCVLELLVFIGGVALCIAYKGATGWDGLALAMGIILAAAAAVLFWLHALSKLALLRLTVRRAFHLGDTEPIGLHRVSTLVQMAIFGLILLGGTIWFVVK
ncbi:MAG: hypothetical protein WBD40_05180 [Tepidisphaeraceae bacterium]